MRHATLLAPLRGALIVLALTAGSAFALPPTLPGAERDPLAFQLDGAAAWQRPGTERPDRPMPELLLRVPPDEFSAALMESTSLANMTATVQRLQDFGSRYVVVDSCWAAGYWLRDRFLDYGYSEVRLDTFHTQTFQDSVDAMNVLVVKEGTARPSEYIVLGGHYDSVSAENQTDPLAPAPGAEDNATAVAAVLEAARILKDIPTDRSIIFACWSAEEEGLWGSRDFVARAVAESLDVAVYLNMDCIGYLEPVPDVAPVIVFTDSLSLAIAGYMQTLCESNTPYELQTCVQPVGASDHTSFWEAGYNVVDTGTTISSPYRHTPLDTIDNIDLGFARAIAAVNVATAAAVAGVTGEDPNLPPETVRVDNCASTMPLVTASPTFVWGGVDFDGEVAFYQHALEMILDPSPGSGGATDWQTLPASRTSISFSDLWDGEYTLSVRAVDDDGAVDPSPLAYEFIVDTSLRPAMTIDANFLPGALAFTGEERPDDARFAVYENELLLFTAESDAVHYCGRADSVSVALNDSTLWSEWAESPVSYEFRPGLSDTALYFRTRDENGAITVARIGLRPVAAPMDRPLLHVDDWFGGDVTEAAHDEFYEFLLEGEDCDVWDPYEHIEGYLPTLPPMEELGRYRTVLWTLSWDGGLLRPSQAESAYHHLEGFVRAGGRLILEGQAALTSFSGRDSYSPSGDYGPGSFVYEHVGIESVVNAGASSNPSYPETYGYAFLGGIDAGALGLPDLPVDTLDKWSGGYQEYGGLPRCEVVAPRAKTDPLYLFDSHLNHTLGGLPCATLYRPDDSTGTVAYLGFPLYYLKDVPAREAFGALLEAVTAWQTPLELISFAWDAVPGAVTFEWSLAPGNEAGLCYVERAVAAHGDSASFSTLNPGGSTPDDSGSYSLTDSTCSQSTVYRYRLRVAEPWGGTTLHGPWEVATPGTGALVALERPRPNPFSENMELHYTVAADGRLLSIAVYNAAGRLVRKLEDGPARIGEHETSWDGRNEQGVRVASGVYFVRARIEPDVAERKVVLLR